MADESSNDAREIREELRKRHLNRVSDLRGRRVPRELKNRALRFARVRVEAGDTLHRISVELGVTRDTLADWLRTPALQGRRILKMRPVVILPAQGDIEMPQLAGPAIVLANGVRIMGLTFEQMKHLLKELK